MAFTWSIAAVAQDAPAAASSVAAPAVDESALYRYLFPGSSAASAAGKVEQTKPGSNSPATDTSSLPGTTVDNEEPTPWTEEQIAALRTGFAEPTRPTAAEDAPGVAQDAAVETFQIRPDGSIGPVALSASPYKDAIASAAAANGIQPELVHAVMQAESAGNPRAVSNKGAAGLMQLMPATAAELGVTNRFDPRQSIAGGAAYLARLLGQFGRLDLAIAAYNAGPGAVQKYGGIPPYSETQAYVRHVMRSLPGRASLAVETAN
ncbi:MAG: lytic transglycosylase domain-containing protein [Luteibacter jiangsuensis]